MSGVTRDVKLDFTTYPGPSSHATWNITILGSFMPLTLTPSSYAPRTYGHRCLSKVDELQHGDSLALAVPRVVNPSRHFPSDSAYGTVAGHSRRPHLSRCLIPKLREKLDPNNTKTTRLVSDP
ncbi:hypothetical protein L6452_08644 [Arctium lappa]|uniref:Uncharacterized protein n=1 Tax=Arctium lappa TaxID=4217 RepID=A0ACB9DI57_ARCLA|nr:hypothetical protein L6452_08644 [Arctium lappa]